MDALKTGFPSELIAEATLKKRNWDVSGNTYFIDQDENKGREIDLRAYLCEQNTKIQPIVCVWLFLSIEIKKSEKPWVIFTSERSRFEKRFLDLLSHLHNDGGLINTNLLKSKHPTLTSVRIGRTSHISFSHDTSTIFGAVVGATKATIDEHRAAQRHGQKWSKDSIDVVFYEPLVVIDGSLFECYLNEKQKMVVQKAKYIQYGLHYASPNYKAHQYMVDIVMLKYLDEYLSLREEWVKNIYSSLFKKAKDKHNVNV